MASPSDAPPPPPAAGPEHLFSPSLLLADASSSTPPTPEGVTIRPLRRDDFGRGYLDCLRVLTWVGDVSEEAWARRYDEMAAARGTYYLLAAERGGRVVGTGSLVVERKFIHNRGLVGHVEEVAVATEHQGEGLGLALLAALDVVARNVGCYKNILNCGARNEPFYVRCGYHNSGTEMSRYFDEAVDDYHRG